MRHPLLLCVFVASLSGSAFSQNFVETFDGGSNEGDFEIWFSNWNTIQTTGGNPGAYLELDNTLGSLTCQFLRVFQNTWPNAFSGDYRALSIASLGIDVNILSGPTSGGELTVELWSDPGTPTDLTDDCGIIINNGDVPPTAVGWASYDIPIDSASLTLPVGADIDGACVGMNSNTVWNSVITDVDYVVFRIDTNPNSFCAFTTWIFGADNIRIDSAPPAVGTNYCQSLPNSSGNAAMISGAGSDVVALNNLLLRAEGLPSGVNGLFYYGAAQTNLPFGDGFRCVAGQVCRLPIQAADANGVMTGQPTLGVDGHPLPACDILAGATWNFQSWFRDPMGGGAGFNLSDGLTVTFQ